MPARCLSRRHHRRQKLAVPRRRRRSRHSPRPIPQTHTGLQLRTRHSRRMRPEAPRTAARSRRGCSHRMPAAQPAQGIHHSRRSRPPDIRPHHSLRRRPGAHLRKLLHHLQRQVANVKQAPICIMHRQRVANNVSYKHGSSLTAHMAAEAVGATTKVSIHSSHHRHLGRRGPGRGCRR